MLIIALFNIILVPEDFQYDPATKTYGDVTRRPEVRSSTIEFIAPSEYMVSNNCFKLYAYFFKFIFKLNF